MDIENRLLKILKEKGNPEMAGAEIGFDDDITAFGISSRSYVMVLVAIENEFGIEIDDEDMSFENFRTINKIKSYIQARM